jgi:hypothetical protein
LQGGHRRRRAFPEVGLPDSLSPRLLLPVYRHLTNLSPTGIDLVQTAH